jgi:hypothetical protein
LKRNFQISDFLRLLPKSFRSGIRKCFPLVHPTSEFPKRDYESIFHPNSRLLFSETIICDSKVKSGIKPQEPAPRFPLRVDRHTKLVSCLIGIMNQPTRLSGRSGRGAEDPSLPPRCVGEAVAGEKSLKLCFGYAHRLCRLNIGN